ncbi:MAG: DUF1292 domain-containing protein [Defluviitaleaceae bacterium]|nr:DUF1292 domain-containing protein [Defluviitaleaceae bacterium]
MSDFEKDFDEFENDDFEDEIIIAEDENGNEKKFIVIDACEVDGANYILVIDIEDDEEDEPEADILKEMSSENDEVFYGIIEDDEEFEKVAALFSSSDEYDIEM